MLGSNPDSILFSPVTKNFQDVKFSRRQKTALLGKMIFRNIIEIRL